MAGSSKLQNMIDRLEAQTSYNHAYPCSHLIGLNRFLKSTSGARPAAGRSDIPAFTPDLNEEQRDSFVILYQVQSKESISFEPGERGLHDLAAYPLGDGPLIIFLRGFPSPAWISAIYDKFRVSAELFRKHMDHQAFLPMPRNQYISPTLPSANSRVFQLNTPSIRVRGDNQSGLEPEDLRLDRKTAKDQLSDYFKALRASGIVADSVVRRFFPVSKAHAVIVQTTTVEVSSHGDSWQAVVWSDSGRDLSQSPTGAWTHMGSRKWESYFLPVIVQKFTADRDSGMDTATAERDLGSTIHIVSTYSSRDGQPQDWRASQNICMLPLQYGSKMDTELARRDVLYALQEVFHFAASAELQLLNLLQERIEQELYFTNDHNHREYEALSFENLSHMKTSLTSQAEGLSQTLYILQNRDASEWPQLRNDPQVEKDRTLLINDFAYLFERAKTLAEECQRGIAVLVSRSSLEEARRSSELAIKVQRLTVLATAFIPLTFLSSIWGMNFQEMGSGSQPIWYLPITAVPIMAITFVFFFWKDILAFGKRLLQDNHSLH